MGDFKADIGIICAMKIELDGISAAMEIDDKKTISGIEFVFGTLCGKKIVCAVCGIGKVFAAVCTEAMILNYSPELIVNSGVAGGLSKTLSVCDAVVASSLVQHDMDTSPLGDPVGLISGINIVNIPCDEGAALLLKECTDALGFHCETGVIASGDQFVASKEKKDFIVNNFSAVACEMEGASVGHVCYINKVKCVVLRAISDGGNDEAVLDYPTFVKKAAHNSCEIIKLFVQKY